ncbi:MAG: hybrid sensor histidine kinase/response regulator [Verrucomicrobiota bacterium]|jgi:two-component system sensor histidine kinase/response regulator
MVQSSQTVPTAEAGVAMPVTVGTAADCLLVADDDETHIHQLRAMLGRLGFEILPATSGTEALNYLAARSPDLILLNLVMRGMDGFELCKRIQENKEWADIPIIFFSPANDKNLLVRALESGGADYLAQPFDKSELLSRIRTHLMLKTARDHLKQLAQEKEELLGMISHYLQNNLAGINMSARLLLDHANGDSKLRFMAENIWTSSNQMRVFIKALLANAAADRGFKIHLESVNFSEAAGRALRQYEDAARAKELVLHHAPLQDGALIQADPAALDQVFDNLISNAIKFSPPHKKILVSLQRGPAYLECRIRDEGPGFTEEDKTRMFHRYSRLSARPTGGEPSSGLGLSIAKKLMQAMHGDLTCQSLPGQGATFILRFPIAHAIT